MRKQKPPRQFSPWGVNPHAITSFTHKNENGSIDIEGILGMPPEPPTHVITARIPEALYQRIRNAARMDRRTVPAFIEIAIEKESVRVENEQMDEVAE